VPHPPPQADAPSFDSIGDALPSGLMPTSMPNDIVQKSTSVKAHQLIDRNLILIVDPREQKIVATIER
jgi:hypothetical protein